MSPRIGVLALQGGVREHADMLESLGVAVVPVRHAGDLAAIDGLVLPGGESSTIDRLLRVFSLTEPLRESLRCGLPALGTCAGLITLATQIVDPAPGQGSLGVVDMEVRRNSFGPQVNSAVERVDTAFGPVEAAFIRAPEVLTVGEGTEIVARREGAIVGVETPSALAVSFHPELTGDTTVHERFLSKVTWDS